MFFKTPSANIKALQENLVVPTLFVLAQAARNKETVSFAQLSDAVIKSMAPETNEDAQKMKRALFDMLGKRELVKSGLASYAKARAEGAPPILNITQRGMAVLGRRFVDMIELPNLQKELTVNPEAPRNLEQSLLMPMLVTLVKMHEEYGLPVKMGQWREGTKRILNLSPEDMGSLVNRSDTKIDQVMRNIRSHNTLRRMGWVIETKDGYIPTEKGMARVAEEFLPILPVPNFTQSIEADASAEASNTVIRPRMRRS